MSKDPQQVGVIGLWHQGVVAAACLTEWGYDVIAADYDTARITNLQAGRAPLFEPGLDDLLARGIASGRLRFTSKPAEAVDGRPFVLLMHDTPVNENDESDLTEILRTVADIAPALEDGVAVYVTAQVPVGTCDELMRVVRRARPKLDVGIAYSPENLRLGQAIDRYRHPPLPVMGSDEAAVMDKLERLFAPCGVVWQRTDLRTAEMSKHALNAFLAVSICFANEIGNLCDEVGADGHRLAEILRLEPRVGPKAMLFPGLGFSGGTLARDMQTLRGLAVQHELETPLLDGAWSSNRRQNGIVVRRLARAFGGSLQDRHIAVLGLTYKPDTSTLRRSAALEVIGDLHRGGARITAHDPKADRAEVGHARAFEFHEDALEAATDADALVLMTPWAQYKSLDFGRARKAMKGNLIFDTANLWSGEKVEAMGFRYLDIGRGRKAGAET
jgi:UDPglucose 6-dehydrogenase